MCTSTLIFLGHLFHHMCAHKLHSSFTTVAPTSFICQDFPERLLLTYKPEEESSPPEDAIPSVDVEPVEPSPEPSSSTEEVATPPSNLDTGDLLVSPLL